MDILNNIYILAVKNKQLISTGLALLINTIIDSDREKEEKPKRFEYLGDNVPLGLIDRIRRSSIVKGQVR